jgi:hypothetical protein
MRALVFLLVLCNLLFFAWAQGYFGLPANPDALRMQQQLKAEQLTVLGRGDPPATPAEETVPAPAPATPEPARQQDKQDKEVEKVADKKEPSACLQWNDLAVGDGDKLERLLVGKFSTLKLKRRTTPGSGTYWVFIPPSGTYQEAEAKAAELRELGVPEYFIVSDSGPNRLAISLGVFSTAEAANARREALRTKGVTGALAGERNVKPSLSTLEVRGPQGQADALREAAGTLLPKSKPAICKGTAPR